MSGLSFHLPDLSNFNHNLRAFLRKKLIDLSTLNSLEQVGRSEKLTEEIHSFKFSKFNCVIS